MPPTKLRHGTPEEAEMLPDRIERVKRLAEGWVAEGHTPSLVVLAARRGVICLHEAFGALTPAEDSPPLQKDSIFPISSITKPITATAIMILVEVCPLNYGNKYSHI
jgi:CubicO group peptidase (beta-lactamase class C family)